MIPPRLRRCSVGLHRVSFHGVNLNVTVTKRGVDVDRWVNQTLHNHRHRLDDLIVGLDIEWHPCLKEEEKKKKNTNPAATLQLCVGHTCLIFQLLHKDYVPNSLLAFLACRFFTFVGVGVKDDANKLFHDHGLVVGNVVDLRDLAERVYRSKDFLRMGLKKIALEVLGKEMEKPLQVTISDWDAKDLTLDQIKYGAIDAFASFQIGLNLFNHNASSQARPRTLTAICHGPSPASGLVPVPVPYWGPRCPSLRHPHRQHQGGYGCLQVT